MKVAAIFLSAFLAAALGVPLGHDVVHEKRDARTSAKLVKKSLGGDLVLPVRIALKQRNLENGASHLMDISNPSSKNYGNHMSADEVAQLFAPKQESIDTVKRWLVDGGVPAKDIKVPNSKGWVDFNATVSHLEELLKTNYHTYQHITTRSEHIGADGYVLPAVVSRHVDFIHPAVAMAKTKRSGSSRLRTGPAIPPQPLSSAEIKAEAEDDCSKTITPECIKSLYNIPDATLHDDSNRMGLFEVDDEMHTQDDLDLFYSKYATKIPKGTGPKINLIDWNNAKPDPNNAQGEAALDFDVALPIIYPQGIELYQTKTQFGESHIGIFNQFLDAVDGAYCKSDGGDDANIDGKTANEQCGTLKPANVISFSYGQDESMFPVSYLKRQCNEFMKLGLQGTTIVFASGDGGVAGGHGNACLGDDKSIFSPAVPAACPFVTSVGATVLPEGSKVGDPESATIRFASGGGFSNVWGSPDYQQDAVKSYFSNNDPGFKSYNTTEGRVPKTGGIYNRAGRGYPDISAIGDNGVIAIQGKIQTTGGTSMSAPIVAAMLTRINDERIKAGKKPIGFANPALYKNAAMFTDVTKGDQAGDDQNPGTCNGKGFKAVTGWDPVTGLGTPKYPEMLKYFMSL